MYPVRRQISVHAAPLRRSATDVEQTIWSAVRNRQIEGFKFRRQVTIGPFVVDFLCAEVMLIIELDGGQHGIERDASRTQFLESRGYSVMRFWNNDVVENVEGVLSVVRETLLDRMAVKNKQKTLTQPSPAKAGEG